jgi:hypothetical protein
MWRPTLATPLSLTVVMAAASARSAASLALASSSEPPSIRGVVQRQHRFSVPLDYSQPNGEKITVFVREVIASKYAESEDPPTLLLLNCWCETSFFD